MRLKRKHLKHLIESMLFENKDDLKSRYKKLSSQDDEGFNEIYDDQISNKPIAGQGGIPTIELYDDDAVSDAQKLYNALKKVPHQEKTHEALINIFTTIQADGTDPMPAFDRYFIKLIEKYNSLTPSGSLAKDLVSFKVLDDNAKDSDKYSVGYSHKQIAGYYNYLKGLTELFEKTNSKTPYLDYAETSGKP